MNRLYNWIKSLIEKFKARQNALFFVNGSEALPLPLTNEEEANLVQLLESGDERIRHKLVEHNLRLVVYIANKFENTGAERDDLISVGAIGLIKAINSFRAEKKIKLATYASRCIENEILMYLRRIAKLKHEVSFDEPLNTDWEGNELLLSDIMGVDADCVYGDLESCSERDILNKAITKLSDREKKIVSMRFGIGEFKREMTQKEVADELGISQSYISRLEKKIMAKLKKEIMKLS